MARPVGLNAEERSNAIAQAIADLKRMIRGQAEAIAWRGDYAFWNEEFGYWAYFGKTSADTKLGWRYWNVFGTSPSDFQKNMLVEINPPQAGLAAGTQGLVAVAADGCRWLLHAGRLHPREARVSADLFAEVSGLKPAKVAFSDGEARPYFPVVNLDADARAVQGGLAEFIEHCRIVRIHVQLSPEQAEIERRVREAEGNSKPERTGSYVIPARPPTIAERIHGDVYKELTAALDSRGIKHSNRRVGRYGPDLRTVGRRPVPYEIKTDTTASSIYEAYGQLALYEKLIGTDHAKLMILPGPPPRDLAKAVRALGIGALTYEMVGRRAGSKAASSIICPADDSRSSRRLVFRDFSGR